MLEVVRIRDVMTPLPLTIDIEHTLADAESRMLKLQVRHLPVLAGERVVGLLSERDVALAAGLGMRLEDVSVGAAMSAGPFIVRPDEELDVVLRGMAAQRLGSAVIMQDERVVGVFTTTDALRLLSHLLKYTRPSEKIELPSPSVSDRLQKEQVILSSIKQAARRTAHAALDDDAQAVAELPVRSQALDQAVLRFTELEEQLLLPELMQLSETGAVRAEFLRERHLRVRRQIHMAHLALQNSDTEHLAYAVLSMCES
jgi:acetoin utilization protein AcuB